MGEVHFDRAAFDRAMFGPSGHVTRWFERRGREIVREAQAICPIGETGTLRDSIEFFADRFGLTITAGAEDDYGNLYGFAVHEGSAPHEIVAHGKFLRIPEGAGYPKPTFVKSVMHPGQQAQPFLEIAAL